MEDHFVVNRGRRWRATDPEIPEDRAAELRKGLMAARRDVGTALRTDDPVAEKRARTRVQAANVALGERGTPWWDVQERRARRR